FGLHGAAVDIHADALPVGVDLQLRERIMDIAELLAKRRKGAVDLRRGHACVAQFQECAQRQQFPESVGFRNRKQFLPLPGFELALGDFEKAPRLRSRVGLLSRSCCHELDFTNSWKTEIPATPAAPAEMHAALFSRVTP